MQGTEKEKLQAEREWTLAELERLRSYLEIEVDRIINGSEDSADAALDVHEREKTLAIIQTLEKKLVSIERALRAVEQGNYGICEVCGRAIDPDRLAIVPHTTTCVKCQEKLERTLPRKPFYTLSMEE